MKVFGRSPAGPAPSPGTLQAASKLAVVVVPTVDIVA
jgi:hypothetical protein